MTVDISFSFAKVYNIEKVDIVKGQVFSIHTDFTGISKWFSDNDPVLSLIVNGNNAEAEAKETGTSTILIMDDALSVQKQLTIRVVDAILPMADELGISAEAPEVK